MGAGRQGHDPARGRAAGFNPVALFFKRGAALSQSDARQERFQRIEEFTEGAFEQDLMIMHQQTQDTLMLNPTAAAIWQALQWPQSAAELTDLLLEAFPAQPRAELAAQVHEALRTLRSRGFIVAKESS